MNLSNIRIFSHIPEGFHKLNVFSPDIIGISAMSTQFSAAIELSRKVKKKLHALIIIGGPHVSALPKVLLETFDIGVIGEGEETLSEIVSLYASNALDNQHLYKIKDGD